MDWNVRASSVVAILVLMAAMVAPVAAGGWQNALAPQGQPGPEMTLAVDGRSNYVIVIPAKPTTQELKAAEDLAHWLGEMTGAVLPIVSDAANPMDFEISVGRTNRYDPASVPNDLGAEGYAIDVQRNRLFLTGGTARGPIYAVYALLEEDLGCRWYHIKATEIPRRSTLKFRPVPRSFVPKFTMRDPFYCDAFNTDWSLRNRTNSARTEVDAAYYTCCGAPSVPAEWGGRAVYVPGFVHTFGMLLPPEEFFKQYPEYFSLIDGQRATTQLCQTHPEVIRIVTERMLKLLDERPDATVLEISPNDTTLYCTCDDCERLNQENGSPAGSLIYFVNEIAEAVEKKHPDMIVSTLAYLSTIDPPSKIRPRPNVTIRLCNDLHAWRYPMNDFITSNFQQSVRFREAIVGWSKICQNITIWDYFVNFSHYMAPSPNMHLLQPSVDFYVAHNVKGIMFQGAFQSPGGERAPLRCWVMAKLFWDPSRRVDALIEDFAWGYFKAAAPAILDYYALLDEVRLANEEYHLRPEVVELGIRYDMNTPMFSGDFLPRAASLFAEAWRLAGDDEELLRRVELEQLPILYVKLMRGPDAGGGADGYAKTLLEFERIARRENVDYRSDEGGGGPGLETILAPWREALRASRSDLPREAEHQPTEANIP